AVAEGGITAAEPARAPLDLLALTAGMRVDRAPVGHALESAQEGQMAFGPRWRVLQATWMDDGQGLAQPRLPDASLAALDRGFILHPALMDIATGWAMDLIPGYDRAQLWVPLSYRALTMHAPLPAAVTSLVRLANASDGYASFDVTLTDAQG